MGFWDELWELLGIAAVVESLREKSEKKQGLEVKQETEINILSQGGLQTEAINLYEILFKFVFYPKLKSSFPVGSNISSGEVPNLKNLNEYSIIVNFVKKFGNEYSQEDFTKLKELLNSKSIFLSDENILSLMLNEKDEQEYLNLKKIILEYNPVLLKDYLEFFVKNFNKEISYLIYCKEKVNKFGIYTMSDGKISVIESITTEGVITEEHTKTTSFIYCDYILKQIVFLVRKLYLFRRLFLEKNSELFNKGIVNDEKLFQDIIDAKKNYDLNKFEESLGHENEIRIDGIDSMEGHEFERFLKTLFERMSYSVEHTKLTGDQGADLVVSKLGEKTVVQAKRSNTKIGNGAIQEVVAAINHYRADKGMVVTNNFFTPAAIELAKSNKISLIDKDELNRLIKDFL